MSWKWFGAGFLVGATTVYLLTQGQYAQWLSSQRDRLKQVSYSFVRDGPYMQESIPTGTSSGSAGLPLEEAPAAIPGPSPEAEATSPGRPSSSCPELSSAFRWGWDVACNAWKVKDETCELFNASKMSNNVSLFLEVATRSADKSYHPNLARLQMRLIEAIQENRPLRVLTMGPSNTVGNGCNKRSDMYWTSALQKLSMLENSQLQLDVIKGARAATPFKFTWSSILREYEKDTTLDVILCDYAVTGIDVENNRHQLFVMNAHVQNWKRPPAILFLETFTQRVMISMEEVPWENLDACTYSNAMEEFDPFFPVLRSLSIPMLSYPDIACALPHLGHRSSSQNGIPFLFTYKGEGNHHYGCGVHFIQAQAIYLFLLQLLQLACIKGFSATMQAALASEAELKMQLKDQHFSLEDKCKMSLITYLAYSGHMNFLAIVANNSKWSFGADRPGKFGWIANYVDEAGRTDSNLPGRVKAPRPASRYPQYDGLGPKEIVFIVKLNLGLVIMEFLSTYQNIGSIWCQVEDMSGKVVSEPVQLDGLWSTKVSLANSATLNANTSRVRDAAVRCTCEEEKKFKLLSVSAC